MTGSRTSNIENALLVSWFVLSLVIGALTVREYGMSIDEPNNYRYAADTLNAYPSLFGTLYPPRYDSTYDGHGPAFVVIAGTLINIVQAAFPDVFVPDLWHFSYYVTFLLTGLCLYWLAKRWFSTWTAWGILLLFSTQPVLMGHAFINPKDIPFTFFLTLSVALGFRLVDVLSEQESFVSLERPVRDLINKFQQTDPVRRRKFVTTFSMALIIIAALVLFSNPISSLIESPVTSFYEAESDSWAGRISNSVITPSRDIPAEAYVMKALKLFRRLEIGVLLLGVFFFLGYFGLLINKKTLSGFLRETWQRRNRFGELTSSSVNSARNTIHWSVLKSWFVDFFQALGNPRLILAGVALGLATGVRAIAPFVGVIVFLYLLAKNRSRAWTTGIAYFLVAGIVTYLAWPRLWDAPVQRYLEGLGVISNFPHFPGRVLFDGQFFGPGELPRPYLPVLLNIQLTEPLILGLYIGIGLLAWQILQDRLRTDLLLYIGLGFAFPLVGLILLRSPLYHNFRQTLFLIPPVFMLAAFALDALFRKMTQAWARVLLIAIVALPGITASVRLYPYQYVYYNSLVGGTAGAYNRYELDYWRISLREMALELNEVAPPESLIVVTRSAGLFARYARPDLIVDKTIDSTLDLSTGYDYLVQVTRWEPWDLYPEVRNIVVIERAGTVLATAKDMRNSVRK